MTAFAIGQLECFFRLVLGAGAPHVFLGDTAGTRRGLRLEGADTMKDRNVIPSNCQPSTECHCLSQAEPSDTDGTINSLPSNTHVSAFKNQWCSYILL